MNFVTFTTPQMSCAEVLNCNECSIADPTECATCSAYLNYNSSTKKCECAKGSGIGCPNGQSCAQEAGICVDKHECYKIDNCTHCTFKDHRKCYKCATGMFLSDDGTACASLAPCKGIKYCNACNPEAPSKCAKCLSGLHPSANGSVCECEVGSGQKCPSRFGCSPTKGGCIPSDTCKSDVNCTFCSIHDRAVCVTCRQGFALDLKTGLCASNETCRAIAGCSGCHLVDSALCGRCEYNLAPNTTGTVCECHPGSGTGCDTGHSCALYARVCVRKNACLSAPELIPDCSSCTYLDNRLCYACEAGFTVSLDRKTCIRDDACLAIAGCTGCTKLQPDRCSACADGHQADIHGAACLCGGKTHCGEGVVCEQGACPAAAVVNRLGAGSIAGIAVGVALGVCVLAAAAVMVVRAVKSRAVAKVERDIAYI
uniref:Cysteine-rich membrane protein 2 n=1 Tax=Spironucleus salmonicida TaxID=348837 RepID=V6LH29_9EUKA|eukprot:EST43837.1 Cysteine-rich membrane protein 2 [Spironucleus salmonicida]